MFKFHSEETKRKISIARKGKLLSEEHKENIGNSLRGRKIVGKGRVINSSGYVMLYLPGHPMAQKKPYVLEHRKVISEYVGRNLEKDEVVHHINGDKRDNRLENLQLIKRKDIGGKRLNAECPNCHYKFHLA